MRKMSKKITKQILPFLICLAASIVLVYVVYLKSNAVAIGGSAGESIGAITGKIMGSFEGLTTGRIEGSEAGKEEGLSAENTTAEIATQMKELQNLEVLVASVKVSDVHTVGVKQDYKALYLVKGEVIFSVDLSKAEVKEVDDTLIISIPQPVGKLIFDPDKIEKKAEFERYLRAGSAEDGMKEMLNTLAKMQDATAETLNNYDSLVNAAKQSAVKQVARLAESSSLNDKTISVEFLESKD
ncbi:DUF4230 domain-containing protein [Butyrivibrio sp. VCB2001]|uniref:DUF4230 domain-containing protein n=1 Tax=Butyrivibrio sp. VCB2001 TaxID=1280667 RepID=UPI0004106394|nr:DUF4230 domain-containing protein [Butyrivibrio sp. VCB2001]